MLRHIISVSLAGLAMTACASLIPIKANAARLILAPAPPDKLNTIYRNPGDLIQVVLLLDDIDFRYPVELESYSVGYDNKELSLVQVVNPIQFNRRLTAPQLLARYIFEVLESVVKDENVDISATAQYRDVPRYGGPLSPPRSVNSNSVYVEPVPEPLTIFGTATALGCGALFKRKLSKKTVS